MSEQKGVSFLPKKDNQEFFLDIRESIYEAVNFVPKGSMTISRLPGKRERDLHGIPEGHKFAAIYVEKKALYVIEDVLAYNVGDTPSQRDLMRAYLMTTLLTEQPAKALVVYIKCQNTKCAASQKATLLNQYIAYAEAYALVMTQTSKMRKENQEFAEQTHTGCCGICKSLIKAEVLYDECFW